MGIVRSWIYEKFYGFAAQRFKLCDLEYMCVKLLGVLTPERAIMLIPQSIDVGSKNLLKRCMETIDSNADEALSSDGKRHY